MASASPPKLHTVLQAPRASLRFYLADCFSVLEALDPHSIDVVVTSPPYNLGIRYRSYDDGIPREEYLDWIGAWSAAIKRILAPGGSLFLNVGSKPTDPWAGMDVANTVRRHLTLQNVVHWIKAIAIDRSGKPGTELAVGHYKPINSDRFLNDCHEF